MSQTNLSQVLSRNIDLLDCQQAIVVNYPVDSFYKDWLAEYPQANIHFFTNNKLNANQLANIKASQVTSSFGCFYDGDVVFDLALIAFPKSKSELAYTLAMLAPHLTENATVLFVGENKGGIKSVAKLSKDYVSNCDKVDAARHCILYAANFIAGDYTFDLDDWYHVYPIALDGIEIKVAALPGVFSQQGLDKGTKVLLENLPCDYQGSLLDFGCGAGVISAFLAKKFPGVTPTGIDISALAIASTEKTLALNGIKGKAIASDGLSEANEKYDHIVSNPPFHQGLNTHYAATELFLAESKKFLNRNGQLTVVANSFLKYLPIMSKSFGSAKLTANIKGFSIYHSIYNLR